LLHFSPLAETLPHHSTLPPVNEATPSQTKHTTVTAVVDKPSTREESSWDARNRRRRAHLPEGRQHQIPANQTTASFSDLIIAFLVFLRISRAIYHILARPVARV
jgi:hypothetical protein